MNDCMGTRKIEKNKNNGKGPSRLTFVFVLLCSCSAFVPSTVFAEVPLCVSCNVSPDSRG